MVLDQSKCWFLRGWEASGLEGSLSRACTIPRGQLWQEQAPELLRNLHFSFDQKLVLQSRGNARAQCLQVGPGLQFSCGVTSGPCSAGGCSAEAPAMRVGGQEMGMCPCWGSQTLHCDVCCP